MKLDTGRDCCHVLREFYLSSFPMPVRASENDVGKILRLSFAANAEVPYMERAIRTYFMPNASQRGIQSTTKAILSTVGTALQMSITLSAETGFQATKVRSSSSYLIRFTPSEVLSLTAPPSFSRCPGKAISK
eukprot:2892061-Amphidinium_carterae.1